LGIFRENEAIKGSRMIKRNY